MGFSHVIRLLSLSAIWGASFLFMRIGAPVLGPALLIQIRVGLAALFLLAVAAWLRRPLPLARQGRHFLMLGGFNSALPFLLFAFAAQTVSASLLSVLNATAPIWAALIGALWQKKRLAPKALLGLALGVAGVALLAGGEALRLPAGGWQAIAAGLAAACSYGIATTYAKSAPAVEPFANAHGSMWGATLLLMPLTLATARPMAMPPTLVWASVLALGVLCSGVAYLLYFRLVADLGAAPALTVTYLIPLFGILWGALLLGEPVGWTMLAGGALVLAGTALVTGFTPWRRG
ncbi:MAG: DMT family transporter [Paludibacterium sp.]|uniref:DMT family transporter n=1 Tax=Paludibacterium sp. TaxID=1917523 RepID=UPI0025FB771E|nr:DMT family transporter [Paludibacterium sp.]MBV8049083.1 DMT family transporter [Paludibacterium sp.]MBV8649407.1 DMT family transporter [Paludibacterium sp.]